MNAPDSHGGWNKVSGKLNRFIDFDNALTHHRDFVFGVLGVTEARSSYEDDDENQCFKLSRHSLHLRQLILYIKKKYTHITQ